MDIRRISGCTNLGLCLEPITLSVIYNGWLRGAPVSQSWALDDEGSKEMIDVSVPVDGGQKVEGALHRV